MLSSLPEHLRHREPLDVTRHGLVAEVEQISKAQSAIDAYRLRIASKIDSLNDSGVNSAEVFRSVCRISNRSAQRDSRTASRMAQLPSTAGKLASGVITAEHVNVIADASRRVSAELADSELAELASTESVDMFAKHAREWVAAKESDEEVASRQARQYANRSFKKWTDDRGMQVWMARLDPITDKKLASRVDEEYERLWRADGGRDLTSSDPLWRSFEQRMADAFCNLVAGPSADDKSGRAARHAAGPSTRHQMTSIVDLSRMTSGDPHGRAALADGTPLPQAVLEHLACISDISGVIFDGPNSPIWAGRTSRSATATQWRALIARDRGCVGCGADPNRCEAHHIVAWSRGGPTDITNLVLVCSRCHHNIHDRGMDLAFSNDSGWKITERARPSPGAVAA